MKKFALIGGAVLFLLVVLKAVLVQMSTIPRALSHSSGTFELSAGQWVFVAALLLVGLATISLIGRGGKVATFALGLIVAAATAVIGGYLLFGDMFPIVVSKLRSDLIAWVERPEPVRATQPASVPSPRNQIDQIPWDNVPEGGMLPVGVWSKPLNIPIGCSWIYSSGNGINYAAQYRFEFQHVWKDHVPGSTTEADQVRFMILEAGRGMTKIPIVINCRQ